MNWLAHLHLAPPDPLERLGNLAGDFVRGADVTALPRAVQRGIHFHRALDRFTDAHPAHRRSRQRIEPRLRRASGVLVDVFYDHCLARAWERWHPGESLRSFANRVDTDLDRHRTALPPRLATAGPGFTLGPWLEDYAEIGGIAAVLGRMERRTGGRVALVAGADWLRRHRDAVDADFARFWPDAERFAARWLAGSDGVATGDAGP